MKFLSINFGLLLTGIVVKASSPIGWGKNTTGGQGGVEYHVSTFKEFKDALYNHGNVNDPKIIYIDGPINGITLDDGSIMNFGNLIPGFSFDKYVACFTEDGSQWLDTPECNQIEELRLQGRPIQNQQIHVDVTPNTTIIGNGNDARLEELSLQIRHTENVIIKNLSIEAPNDYFPEWDPTDGIHGSWNAEYDAIVIKNATNVWVDNCYLGDGSKGVNTNPKIFGHYVETHDGLLDVVDAADYITISNNRFENHKKTMLIGNSDSRQTDRDHLKVTIYNNVFINCNERMPRVRFGKVHVFNNYYYAETFNEAYESLTVDNYFHDDNVFPQYFIGLGVESNVLSEYNSFHYAGNEEIPATNDIIVYSYGGYIFHDIGSEFNGQTLNIDGLAEKSFKLKVKTKMAQNAANGKTNPAWVNASFTTDVFDPREFYDYDVVENIDAVNDLINKVPSWMFGMDNESNDHPLVETNPVEPVNPALGSETYPSISESESQPINNNESSMEYYLSCEPQAYECKSKKAFECYDNLSQCYSQTQENNYEKCIEINNICSKIWN